MGKTTIAWTTDTWNPVRGCSVVSPGCTNCYAMKQAHRFSGEGAAYAGLTKLTNGGPVWTGDVMLVPELLDQPLRWRKPRRIFVNSMSDLFHEGVPDNYIAKVFAVMAQAPRHTFQVLTKRPERMREWVAKWDRGDAETRCLMGARLPLPNVHLGVSVEDQTRADARIPVLLDTPAAVRFISAEPLLGPIVLKQQNPDGFWPPNAPQPDRAWLRHKDWPDDFQYWGTGLDWVIVGGESGPGARECEVAWIRSIVAQCAAAKVPAFVKQLGARPFVEDSDWSSFSVTWGKQAGTDEHGETHEVRFADRKGADPSEWPADLRVQEFPR